MKVVLNTNVIVRRMYRLDGQHVAILERVIALGAVELVVLARYFGTPGR